MKRTTIRCLGPQGPAHALIFFRRDQAVIMVEGDAMAGTRSHHIAVAAGLACAGSLAVPQTACGLEISLEGIRTFAAGDLAPFAVGAVVGCAVTSTVAAYHLHAMEKGASADARRAAAEQALEPDPVLADDVTASIPKHKPARRKQLTAQFTGQLTGQITGALRSLHRDPSEGVPVIARAGGMSEEEAWAEIDSFMSETPFGCDPDTSHDLYEIALAELATRRGPAPAPAAGSASPRIEEERRADAAAALRTLDSLGDLEEPEKPVPPVPIARTGRPAQASAPRADAPRQPAPVAMADYSGHEDMWAAALAVFEDDDAPAAPAAPAARADAPAAVCARPGAQSPADSTGVFLAAAKIAALQTLKPSAPAQSAATTASIPAQQVLLVPAYAVPVSALASEAPAVSAADRVREIFNEELVRAEDDRRAGVRRPHLHVVDGRTQAMPRLTSQMA